MRRQDAMTTVQIMLACCRRARIARRGARGARTAGTDAGSPPPRAAALSPCRLAGEARRSALLLACLTAALAAGCSINPDNLHPPHVLAAPYDTVDGPVLWAVVPLANESGTSVAEPMAVTDALVARITETRGLAAVPANRTIGAMRALGMTQVATVADARVLAKALGVDGIVVGSITAWDPYDPPKLGLSLALFAREGSLRTGGDWLDPVALEMAYTDQGLTPTTDAAVLQKPASVVAGHLDGANHETQMEVRRYAEGRHDYEAALGWRRYLASMDLYTDFAAYWAVRGLLDSERLRLARLVRQTTQVSSSPRQ